LRILGLDLGERRIGVAVSDETGLIAQAVEVIERRGPAEDMARIAELVRRFDAGRIVVGLPKNMDGTVGPAGQKALAFAADLREAVGVPVDTWDERLSTAEVNRMLVDSDVSRARRRKVVDKLAAAVILQGYLASRRRERFS